MSAAVFVDTNVLVYARDARSRAKHQRAREWLEMLWDTRRGRVSAQVLHEYYVTVTRKLKPGLDEKSARADVRDLFHWLVPSDPQGVIEAAWELRDGFSVSFWDALIVAAAQSAGCEHLLSEDLSAGQRLGSVRVVDPFETSPAALGG